MTTAGQVAIVLGMLALLAGGSLIAWIFLFLSASKAERTQRHIPTPPPPVGDHV
jgi:hypothetical protein